MSEPAPRQGLALDLLRAFLRESLTIEGIAREPTRAEVRATETFLAQPVSVQAIEALQAAYTPGQPLRDKRGMDVRVGNHTPPAGGPGIALSLMSSCPRLRSATILGRCTSDLSRCIRSWTATAEPGARYGRGT